MTTTGISMTSKAVMLVDDESDIVLIFKKVLELAGYPVFAFTDPATAFEHFKENATDYGLIVSDIRMPRMNGIEFATKAREVNNSIPIILMSAFEMTSLEVSPDLNIARYLQKPIMPAEFRRIVSEYVSIIAK